MANLTKDSELRERLVALTRDLILIPTTATRPEDMRRGFQFIKNHLEDLSGIAIEDHEHNGLASLVVRPGKIKKPALLICAHLDVVDYPTPEFFQSKVENGRIVGPGAGDMKGSLAIALKVFHDIHVRYPGASLGLAITSDEERGGASGMGFLVDKKKLRCGVALVPDGGSLHQITTHEKGILHLKIKTKGHYSHASRPWEGDNALATLVAALDQIAHLFDGMKAKKGFWHPTCSPTLIGTSNDVINRIPQDAYAVLDVRFPPPYTSKQILQEIKLAAGVPLEADVLIKAEPSTLKPDPEFLRITEEVTRRAVEEVQDHGGSDARFLSAHGIPVLISRPRVGHLHSEEEWIDIDSMVDFYRIYDTYIRQKLKLPASN